MRPHHILEHTVVEAGFSYGESPDESKNWQKIPHRHVNLVHPRHPTAGCELPYYHLSGDAYLLSVEDFGR